MHKQHLKIGVCTLILDVTRQKVDIILNASLPCCPGALAVHDGGERVEKAVGNLERKRHLIASKL